MSLEARARVRRPILTIIGDSSGSKDMKAVRLHTFGGPEVLQLDTNVPLPTIGTEEVLVCVKAVGVNPVDTFVRGGADSNLPKFPFIFSNQRNMIQGAKQVGFTACHSGKLLLVYTSPRVF